MDKIIALLVTIVAVVAVATVVIFGGINPAIDAKKDQVLQQMEGLPNNSIGG